MKVVCSKCGKSYKIPEEKLPMGKKVFFPCPNCQAKIKLDLRPGNAANDQASIEAQVPSDPDPEKQKERERVGLGLCGL